MDSLSATDLRAVGEFRLLARLGSGGMGQVFLASSLAGRTVAVKVIHAELCRDADFVRRFRNEVEAAQKVSGWYTAPVVAEYQRPALQLPRAAAREAREPRDGRDAREDRSRDDRARDSGEERTILFNLSGHGHFDMAAYDNYFAGKLIDLALADDELTRALEAIEGLPVPA